MIGDLATSVPHSVDPDYLLGHVVGSGGMGIVYSATQVSLGRRVAIKVLHPELATNPFVIRRFRTEALAGGRLDHPNIARVIAFGGRDGTPFLVMEYVGGTSLENLVTEQGPFETRIAADLCGQILAALDEAHTAGVIHADIKSGNVLVETLSDGVLLARVIDFGLARFCNEPSSHYERRLSGTPDYLAPELVYGGPPTVASDIYAVGVVLYELLTGTTPFGGASTEEILRCHVDDAVVPPSSRCPDQGIPDAIEDVVMRALAKDPSARFANAAVFAAALRAATPVAIIPTTRIPHRIRRSMLATEATTRNWPPDPLPVRAAAELATSRNRRVQQMHRAVASAIVGCDGDVIVASYLELVRALIENRQLAAAATELEHGLTLLRPVASSSATPLAVWRLQLCLAGLYSGLGDPVRARSAARLGHADAVRAASRLGQDRASELLDRLTRHSSSPRTN